MENKVKNYELDDCVQRNIDSEGSFEIPSLEEKEDIKVGDCVKLVFKGEFTERMWVKVSARIGDTQFEGTLGSLPIVMDLDFGDKIVFDYKNICGIFKGEVK